MAPSLDYIRSATAVANPMKPGLPLADDCSPASNASDHTRATSECSESGSGNAETPPPTPKGQRTPLSRTPLAAKTQLRSDASLFVPRAPNADAGGNTRTAKATAAATKVLHVICNCFGTFLKDVQVLDKGSVTSVNVELTDLPQYSPWPVEHMRMARSNALQTILQALNTSLGHGIKSMSQVGQGLRLEVYGAANKGNSQGLCWEFQQGRCTRANCKWGHIVAEVFEISVVLPEPPLMQQQQQPPWTPEQPPPLAQQPWLGPHVAIVPVLVGPDGVPQFPPDFVPPLATRAGDMPPPYPADVAEAVSPGASPFASPRLPPAQPPVDALQLPDMSPILSFPVNQLPAGAQALSWADMSDEDPMN